MIKGGEGACFRMKCDLAICTTTQTAAAVISFHLLSDAAFLVSKTCSSTTLTTKFYLTLPNTTPGDNVTHNCLWHLLKRDLKEGIVISRVIETQCSVPFWIKGLYVESIIYLTVTKFKLGKGNDATTANNLGAIELTALS